LISGITIIYIIIQSLLSCRVRTFPQIFSCLAFIYSVKKKEDNPSSVAYLIVSVVQGFSASEVDKQYVYDIKIYYMKSIWIFIGFELLHVFYCNNISNEW
jgi:hypothetical protein